MPLAELNKEKDKSGLKEWLWSWIRDFIEVGFTVAIILIILRITLGAHMLVPLVVVTSGSMVHGPNDNSWKTWLMDHNISSDSIENFPLRNGFYRGDMIIVISPEAKLGDVVIYERDLVHISIMGIEPIIHRAVGVAYVKDWQIINVTGTLDCITEENMQKYVQLIKECKEGKADSCPYPSIPEKSEFKMFITKGDHNEATDQCSPRGGIALPINEAQITGRGWIRLPYIGYLKLILNGIISIFKWIFLGG